MIMRGTPVDTGRWLRWAHWGTTITVVVFLWGQYESYSKAREELMARVVQLEVRVEAVRMLIEQRHAEDEQRLNIHREDIRSLQESIARHFDRFPGRSGATP